MSLASPRAPVAIPGFDCRQANVLAERIVCSDPALARLDVQLNNAHQQALAVSEREEPVRAAQADWVERVRNACQDAPCLTRAYTERIAVLTAAISSDGDPWVNRMV